MIKAAWELLAAMFNVALSDMNNHFFLLFILTLSAVIIYLFVKRMRR